MEDQSHKESNFSLETTKLSNDDPTTGSYGPSTWIKSLSGVDMWVSTSPDSGKSSDFFELLKLSDLDDTIIVLNRENPIWKSPVIHLLHVDRTALPTVWRNISPSSQHEEPELLYAITTDQEEIIDQTTRRSVNRILQQRDFTTAYIWHRPYASHFVASIISKLDTLHQYEDPPVDDIQYAEYFIKDFASYINHDIHHIDMVDIKIDEDDYVSIKWERDGRSLYFEIKEEYVYFTKLWFQDGRLISSDGTLTEEIYEETWKWIINGNL